MKRKVLSALLSVAMIATLLVGCGGDKPAQDAPAADAPAESEAPAADAAPAEGDGADAAAPAGEGGLIGVAMPTKDLQRWNQYGF